MACTGIPQLRLIKLFINTDISGLNIRTELIQSGFLCLFIDPEQYNSSIQGQRSEYISTGNGSFRKVGLGRRMINIRADYTESNIKRGVTLIAKEALKTDTDLTIHDYVHPEPEDNVFTIRTGIINELSSNGEMNNIAGTRFTPNGFSFMFSEKVLRYI